MGIGCTFATMNRIVTFLTDQQLRKLEALRKETGEAASTLIRIALTEYLQKKDKERAKV